VLLGGEGASVLADGWPFVAAGPEDPFRGRVAGRDDAVRVPDHDALGHVRHHRPVALLAGQERLLGQLAVVDVHVGSVPVDHLPGGIPDWMASGEEPTVHAVMAAQTLLDLGRLTRCEGIRHRRPGRRPVVGVQRPHPPVAQGLLPGHAGEVAPRRVAVGHETILANRPDQGRDGVHHLAEAGLALPQRLLG
jgi:hypothetical protein